VDSIPFLDTNVVVRFVAQDHLDHWRRATELFKSVERGEMRVRITDTVVFETAYVLEGPYGWGREPIRAALTPVIAFDGVILPDKEIYPDVFALYVSRRSLSFADCYHAVLSQHLGCTAFMSFDRGFDRIPGITRIEPQAPNR
jgi:predicted nucleic acid-binding protein